jgi:hypothetical protein
MQISTQLGGIMSKKKGKDTSKQPYSSSQVIAVPIFREEIDIPKLGRALLMIAEANREKRRQGENEGGTQTTKLN